MGIDRIMFSVDWPWDTNVEGVNFIDNLPLSQEDKEKLLHGNAERLLKM
jgi:predicted TIM-barrel fold metal-dependent hydrolase